MRWRTDKPTADVIVAQLGYPELYHYEVLTRQSNGEYKGEHDTHPIHLILKWADLEEDESVMNCNELEEEIRRYLKEGDIGKSRLNTERYNLDIVYVARHFAKWGMEHKEQPTIDENELEKAARIYAIDNWIAAENWEDAAYRTFIAGAKWGAEHLNK